MWKISNVTESLKYKIFFLKLNLTFPSVLRCSDLLHLAVLHPRKLSVYSVSGKNPSRAESLLLFFTCCSNLLPPLFPGMAGNVEHGDQYQLKLVYEHNLQRTACCMTHGTFGGVSGVFLNTFSLSLLQGEQHV